MLKTLQSGMRRRQRGDFTFVMEEWRARRVVSPFFPQIVPRTNAQLPLFPDDLA